MRTLLPILLVVITSGCGVTPPRVSYAKYSTDAAEKSTVAQGSQVFRQKRSILKIDFKDGKFNITAIPSELGPDHKYTPLYQIVGADDWRSTTQIAPVYVDSTRFLDEVKITTKDNVSDTISKIGDVAKAVVPLVASFVSATVADRKFSPTLIDPAAPEVEKWQVDSINSGYCMRLREKVSESSLSMLTFIAKTAGSSVNTFPVVACSTGIIDISEQNDPKSNCSTADKNIIESLRVTFGDSTNVTPIGLPSSGSVKMGLVCGASITPSDKQDRSDILVYLATATKQAQDLQTAWKAAKDKKK